MKQASKQLVPLAAALAALTLATPARAISIDAGDYTALPAGTNLLLVYGAQATRDKLYSQGTKVPINPGLDSTVGVLRGVHFMDIGGYIVDPQFLLPFGRLKGKNDTAFLGSESGVADLILAATVWLTKPGAKTHFGITPFLTLPTGDYDRNRALNLGENRWRFTLGAGYITEIAPGWNWDIAGDFTIHGENSDANDGGGGRTELKQKPLFELQTHLRYNISPALDLRAGLFHIFGGETRLGGIDQDNRQSTTKFNIGSAWFAAPTVQLLATYGRDLKVREGFKVENRLDLRLLKIF